MPFKPGQSGNPNGRPKGTQDRRSLVFQRLVPYGDPLVAKAVALALDGDTQMLTLCLNKLIPNPKPIERTTQIDAFTGTLTERGERVIQSVADGHLTPGEATTLLGALSAQARLVELDELAQRIEALEHAAGRSAS